MFFDNQKKRSNQIKTQRQERSRNIFTFPSFFKKPWKKNPTVKITVITVATAQLGVSDNDLPSLRYSSLSICGSKIKIPDLIFTRQSLFCFWSSEKQKPSSWIWLVHVEQTFQTLMGLVGMMGFRLCYKLENKPSEIFKKACMVVLRNWSIVGPLNLDLTGWGFHVGGVTWRRVSVFSSFAYFLW